MGRTSIAWTRCLLLAVAAAACSDDPQREGGVSTPPLVEALEVMAPPAAPIVPPLAVAPVARAPAARKPAVRPPVAAPSPPVSLEKLLNVPPYTIARPVEPDIDELLRLAIVPEQSGDAASADDEAASASKLRVDLDMRTETPIARPDLKREQVDAAAALEVGRDTVIRGGIRIERDSNDGIESIRNTTPTIGIEKRF